MYILNKYNWLFSYKVFFKKYGGMISIQWSYLVFQNVNSFSLVSWVDTQYLKILWKKIIHWMKNVQKQNV